MSWARRFFLVGHHQTCSLSPFPPPFNPHPHRLKYANEHCSTRFVRSAAGLLFLSLLSGSLLHHPNERDGQTFLRSGGGNGPSLQKYVFHTPFSLLFMLLTIVVTFLAFFPFQPDSLVVVVVVAGATSSNTDLHSEKEKKRNV